MIRLRIVFAVYLLVCLPLAAQVQGSDVDEQDVPTAYISARVSPVGNVSITVSSNGLPDNEDAALLSAVPAALGCKWAGDLTDYSIEGLCRGWLKPTAGSSIARLHLADLVQSVRNHGVRVVTVYLQASSKTVLPKSWENGRTGRFYFSSSRPEDLPPDVPIPIETPLSLSIPILVVLLVPAALAYWVRLRAVSGPPERRVNWVVWLRWISLGAWLYWIGATTVAHIGDTLISAGFSSYLAWILGAFLYAIPPLLCQVPCLMAACSLRGSTMESFQLILRRELVGAARMIVPLGIFLVALDMDFQWGLPFLSLGVGYVAYRALAWAYWNLSYGNMIPIESGDLFERASALARKAGVTIARLNLLQTQSRDEVNAYASSGDVIILTEGLVRGLTAREVDAVIAHELGHHKSGHLRFNSSHLLLGAYFVIAGPLLGWLMSRFQIPSWILTVPISPVLFLMTQGLLSQRHELAADARAVEITNDPEGKIAALARLAQLTRIPVQWRGITASILSHPSMERRVLALARRFHVADERALAILRDPDRAYTIGPPAFAASEDIPTKESGQKPVFDLRAKARYFEQLRWLFLLAPLTGACLLGAAAGALLWYLQYLPLLHWYFPAIPALHLSTLLGPHSAHRLLRTIELLMLLLAPTPVLAFMILMEHLLWLHFCSRLRRKLVQRLAPTEGAVFASIHPGRGVRYTEGFSDWDFGFLTLDDDWFCYRGERTLFAIARQDVTAISLVKGPFTWLRGNRIEIIFRGGALTLGVHKRGADWLRDWAFAPPTPQAANPAPEPPPLLPDLPGQESTRIYSIKSVCVITLQLFIAGTLIAVVGNRLVSTEAAAAAMCVAFVAPLAVFLRFLPAIIWPLRRPIQTEDPPVLVADASAG